MEMGGDPRAGSQFSPAALVLESDLFLFLNYPWHFTDRAIFSVDETTGYYALP